MASLRELMGRVRHTDSVIPNVPVTGSVSLLQDFWCYNHRPDESTLSLREQLRLMAGKHFHINLILVGDELLVEKHGRRINGSAHHMREIYAAFGLGVVRIEHYAVTTAQANGLNEIEYDHEALLTNAWTVHNNGIDVFMVLRSWGNEEKELMTGGKSPIGGPCDKDYAKDMTGCVVANDSPVDTVGRVMAHELGHYLGLPHRPDKDIGEVTKADQTHENIRNLMFPLQIGGRELTDDQIRTIRSHCFIFKGD